MKQMESRFESLRARPSLPGERRRGFIAMLSLILLIILGIFGVAYWLASRMTTDQILREAHRVQARNFAQAAVEKVKVNIMNQYRLGNRNMDYPSGFIVDRVDREYARDFAEGGYRVLSVKPFSQEGSDLRMLNLPYFKNRLLVGYYDVWEIEALGWAGEKSVEANIRTLVKVIRNVVQY